MSHIRRRMGLLILLPALVGLTACGSNAPERLSVSGATLEGTVKYGTDQLQFAQITVTNGSTNVTGRIGDDGRYKVENVPLGEVMIGVNTQAAMGEYTSRVMAGGAYKGVEAKGRGKVDLKMIDVPAKYADPQASGIKTTINSGSNTFDITIPKGK